MLDPILLRTFLVIADGNSFSETSRKLSMRQSTVSDHVRRLEECLGRRLFARDTHSVALTPDGEALVGFAQSILDTTERAERHFAGVQLRGRVRFGASEDLVVSFLPDVLGDFRTNHPEIDLELTVALSTTLIARFDAGELDVVFCKRWPGEDRGDLVWRDEVEWAGPADSSRRSGLDDGPLPLILYRPPSITRSIVIAALAQVKLAWRLACTSDSLSGLVAATQAGLGYTVLARKLMPPGLKALETRDLPRLGTMEFVLLRNARSPRAPISELAAAIMAKGRTFG